MNSVVDFRQLSSSEFALIGVQDMAYIKPVQLPEGLMGFGVFSADGRPVAMAPSMEVAQALVRQHDLEPVLTH